tara:strand:- start:351 stop:869 length:519 start_codon:yes stop_codon:yes gene_type:complete
MDIDNFEEYFLTKYGYILPTSLIIKRIIEFTQKKPILEVGAGNGLLAHILKNNGQNITPTDLKPEKQGKLKYTWFKYFLDVEKLSGVDAVNKYNNHEILMICWPDKLKWAGDTLQSFKGDKFIYIGDRYKTGDMGLINRLSKDWVKEESTIMDSIIKSYNPKLYFYKRKNNE